MYTKIPRNLKTDNVIPLVSEIPSLLTSFRHPRKNRSVSVGPQSAADAYEALAFRDKTRRESNSLSSGLRPINRNRAGNNTDPGYFSILPSKNNSIVPEKFRSTGLPTPAQSGVDLYKDMLSSEVILDAPLTPSTLPSGLSTPTRRPSDDRRQDEKEEREMFSLLEKPRVRYDVEVVTKLIVYTGIAWLAVEGNPLFFQSVGLGLEKCASCG